MRINFIPKTALGRRSVWLITTFFLLLVLLRLLVAYGQRGGPTFFSNPLLAFPAIVAAISACVAFFTGIFSIIKRKEKAILVFLSTIIGFLVVLFVLGEIFFFVILSCTRINIW